MLKYIIVDDSKTRRDKITHLLSESFGDNISILECNNTSNARNALRNNQFDVLILDVVLPILDETPDKRNGLNLLNEIRESKKLYKPRKIIGITSHFSDIESFRNEFEKSCFSVIEASYRNQNWRNKIIDSINYQINSDISNNISESEIICLSVHGIRTTGYWQEKLEDSFSSNIKNIDFEIFKYGYFNIISFFIPFLRYKVINRFKKDLELLNKKNKPIYIFCHSFGTYIVIKAIEGVLKNDISLNIKQIILCGSVLKSHHNFADILEKTDVRIINDCGQNDLILLLSEIFVPNTGMAGRVGFYGLNNKRFVNRFFIGGHSLYFKDADFIKKYWLPTFSNNENIRIIDQRNKSSTSFVLISILNSIISTIAKFKEPIYIIIIFYLFYSFIIS